MSESTKLAFELDVREVVQISDFLRKKRLKWKAGVPASLCDSQIKNDARRFSFSVHVF